MSDTVGARSGLRSRKKLGKKAAETFPPINLFLPNDVVIDILSRLPAKDVLRCRCVCPTWRDVTSTKDFIDLHFRRSFPMILKDDGKFGGRWSLMDRCWEPTQTRSKIHKLYRPDGKHVKSSQNGLIIVADRGCNERESVFIICNPIYPDVVKIKVTNRPYCYGRVCGVFYHPVLKEYCILWQNVLSCRPCRVQYRILNLESNPVWRDICTQNTSIFYNVEPVLIERYLYWIANPSPFDYSYHYEDIMEYDVLKEELRVIPCPARIKFEHVNLLNIDGVVSVVQVDLPSKEYVEIKIWTLNDDGEPLWMCCNYTIRSDFNAYHIDPKAIAFWNGELVLLARRRLYACNLKLGSFRKLGQQNNPADEVENNQP